MRKLTLAFTTALLGAILPATASAEGFLAGRLEKLPDLVIGLGDGGYETSKDTYELTTGKGYRLWLKATGKKECAFVAPDFFQNVWFRKVEVNKVEIKASAFHEIESSAKVKPNFSSRRSNPESTPGAARVLKTRA